jgi:hypothetical protein
VKQLKKRLRIELACAVAISIMLASMIVYLNQPRRSESGTLQSMSVQSLGSRGHSDTTTVQVISEEIQGKLRKGEFETTVKGVRSLASSYGGTVPNLDMRYENELWHGTLNCRIPTDNVTSFTFDVRKLINDHGKVMSIMIDINEVEVNQSQTQETPMSQISMYLYEEGEGTSPILDQIGSIIPVLTTGLAWIAEALIIGVPLIFVSLGIVVAMDRGIIPVWKKQLRGKGHQKDESSRSTAKPVQNT